MASSASPSTGSTDVLAVCWKAGTLGCAFLDGTVLRFCEAADAAPGFAVLQSLKFERNPALLVAPSSSDPRFVEQLERPVLADGATAEPADAAGAHPDAHP